MVRTTDTTGMAGINRLYFRALCFERWRPKQKEGISDEAFEKYWGDLADSTKLVRDVSIPHLILPYSLSRSEIQELREESRSSNLVQVGLFCLWGGRVGATEGRGRVCGWYPWVEG